MTLSDLKKESRDEAVQRRIAEKGLHAEDIRHAGRLTEEQIASIPTNTVFDWIKMGKWRLKDFQKWLDSFTYEEE